MRHPRALRRCETGGTAVEFALVVPVMLVLIMGLGELAYTSYVRAILVGAMQKAGRDSSIQGGADQAATIDQKVSDAVGAIVRQATFASSRKSYQKFGYIAAEPFTDSNGNRIRDPGECFTDINGNGTWDADPGSTGQGGASDVTVYTMSVTYPHLFPVARLVGLGAQQTVASTVIIKNQPYATQSTAAPPTVCT